MRENNAVSSTSPNIGDTVSTLLDLVVDSTETGSGIADFLAELTRLTAEELSRPEREVSCGITVTRGKQPLSLIHI